MMDNIKIRELDNSEVEIEAEIPKEEFGKYRKESLKHLADKISLDGFRKGHIPENVLVSKLGEEAILQEMAERAVARTYPEIIKEIKEGYDE